MGCFPYVDDGLGWRDSLSLRASCTRGHTQNFVNCASTGTRSHVRGLFFTATQEHACRVTSDEHAVKNEIFK